MKIAQVAVTIVALVGYTIAAGYGSGGGSSGYGGRSGGGSAGYGGSSHGGGSVTYSGGSSHGGGSVAYSAGNSGVGSFSGGASSFGSEGGASSFHGGSAGGGRSFGGGGGKSGAEAAPKPYSFDYSAADDGGNNHYRNEQGDENGNVRGTYGYTDNQGLFRIVEYVADLSGFRSTIRTNEPGVDGKENPADVVLTAEQPPAGLQDRFFSGGGGGRSGGEAGGYGGGVHGAFKGAAGGGGGGGASYGGGAATAGAGVSHGGGAGAAVRSGKRRY